MGTGVVVDERDVVASRGTDPVIAARGEAGVALECEERDLGVSLANAFDGTVAGRVVDDDHFELVARPIERPSPSRQAMVSSAPL